MIHWTRAQKEAITARGGDLLVSAAAGSGKTAVLTERIVSLVTEGDAPVDIDRLLVVTFSRAAAAEMKRRVAKRLHELLREEPGNARVRRQLLLLDRADISTIHSFCFRLIRENAPALGLPGDLRLGDEQEMKILRQRVAAALLDEEYKSGDPLFFRLVELLSGAKTDRNIQENILTLYDFIRNHPHYEEWVQTLLQDNAMGNFEESPWCAILKNYAKEALEGALAQLRRAQMLSQGAEPLAEKLTPLLSGDILMLEDLYDALSRESWDVIICKALDLSFPRFPTIRDPEVLALKEEIHAIRKEVSAAVSSLKDKVFLMTAEEAERDDRELRPLIQKLFTLVLRFDRKFTEEKLLRGKIDFSDQEHYALRLLGGREHPTELARQLSRQYAEILMDEYQDTNALQEEIFASIAAEKTPRFMVGDVKQSIYRFREACPEIFLEKKQSYAPYDGRHYPAVLVLSENFRTRREITDFANALFADLMSPVIGEMTYGQEDALRACFPYDYESPIPVTMLELDTAGQKRADAVEEEADMVAQKIAALLRERFLVTEGGEKRPAEPRDFCILMRTAKNRSDVYLKALERVGLTGRIEQREGFLAAREIVPVFSMLKVLENPVLDLELARVLVSPLYGCTADDLAEVRAVCRRNLYETMQREPFSGNERFRAFLEDYHALRALMQSAPCSEVLRELYRRTDYPKKLSAMREGERMTANLRLLTEYAEEFEENRRAGEDFTEYLTHLEEYDYDLPAASPPGENAISIMTVHRSKGLEFPVVFLVDLAAKFNLDDSRSDVALNRELGFTCKLRDNRVMRQHKTLPFVAMLLENQRAMLSEEMRILYVAVTRAREKLFLTAAGDLGKRRERAERHKEFFPVAAVRGAGCFYDWLTPTVLRLSEERCSHVERISWVPDQRDEAQKERGEAQEPVDADATILKTLRENMAYQYPYRKETRTPRRISVSDLAEQHTNREFLLRRRPKVLTTEGLSAAERGTAAHKVMQFAEFAALKKDAEAEVRRLMREGFLYEEEGRNLELGMIIRFLETDLGKRLTSAEKVYREIRFMQEFSPEELAAIDPSLCIESRTVLMGAVDCVFIEQGSAVLLDYKTDRTWHPEELRRRYAAQVRLYREIVTRQMGVPVRETYLYSFYSGEAVPIL